MKRMQRGLPWSFTEMMAVCPYRTLLTFSRIPDPQPDRYVTQIGFGPVEDFSIESRNEIVGWLHVGETVMLYSNRADIRDHVKRVIMLAASAPEGSA
jgi:hypothetical protein